MKFRELTLDQFVVIVRNVRIPVELAFVVRVENAVVEARPNSEVMAGIDESRDYIGLPLAATS